MPDFAKNSGPRQTASNPADDRVELSRLGNFVAPQLSVIAGWLISSAFFILGNIFTAHITGNLVLASATAVRGRQWRFRVFIVAAAAWRLPDASPTSRTSTAQPWRGRCLAFSLSCWLRF